MNNIQTLVSILKNHSIDVVGYCEKQGLISVVASYTHIDGNFFVKETIPATKKDVHEWLGY